MDKQIFKYIRKANPIYVNKIEKAYIECIAIKKYKIIIWSSSYKNRELMRNCILKYNQKYNNYIEKSIIPKITKTGTWDIVFKNGSSIRITLPLQSQRGLRCNYSIIEDCIKDESLNDNKYKIPMILHSTIMDSKTLLKTNSIINKILKAIFNRHKVYDTFNLDDLIKEH